jgi:nitronate monooxygenase
MMPIRTALTEAFGLDVPIVLAPMGRVAGGRLAAALSNAGGLRLVGGAYGDPEWLHRELSLVRAGTDRPWGVGLITWYARPEVVELALSYQPAVFLLSFGDVRPYADAIKAAGCTLLCQVQEVEAAREPPKTAWTVCMRM